jgi:hypothetical protein
VAQDLEEAIVEAAFANLVHELLLCGSVTGVERWRDLAIKSSI